MGTAVMITWAGLFPISGPTREALVGWFVKIKWAGELNFGGLTY